MLNAQQLAAATHGRRNPDGAFESAPLLILAGAGTGKTATIAHRVAHLVLQGVDPMRMLLLTFSRRAAQEMIRRAQRLLADALGRAASGGAEPPVLPLPWAGTFHSVGARLLRRHAPRIGLDPDFGILDRGDSADLLDLIRHAQGLSARQRRFPRKDTCLAIYSMRVNSGLPLEHVLQRDFPWCAEWSFELTALYRDYVARKQASRVLDYDDLLLWWHAAMREPAVAREIGAAFDHVLVDEYQDTNALQSQILLALKPDGAGLTVVGDDAQSIYAFRAADVENILGFAQRFEPPARVITLQSNYRSLQPILDVANALLAQSRRAHRKTLHSHRSAGKPAGERAALVTVLDDRAQADWLIAQVLRQREAGVALKRQAVLFRSAHHSDLLEVELTRRNIPYVKHGGLKFLESVHVKDVLALLRWADNPRNAIAAFRTLQLLTGMGPAHAQRCCDHVAGAGHRLQSLRGFEPPPASQPQWPEFAALMAALAEPDARWSGQLDSVRRWYQPILEQRHDDAGVRAADLDMLASIAAQFGTRERFLTELTLDPPAASGDLAGDPRLDDDYLILSTVHSAKGQEWDAVYVINVADGSFPNEYSTGSDAGIDEERRLLYVALTRARDSLYLIEPLRYYVTNQPRLGATYVHGARSRFLDASVLACLQRIDAAGAGATDAPGAASDAGGRGAAADVAAQLRQMW